MLAGLKDYINHWLDRFPQSSVLFTGGDSTFLQQALQTDQISHKTQLIGDRQLIFRGMQHCWQWRLDQQ
jgi:type III pantothenate kinase